MILKSLKLTYFKNFENFETAFDSLNFLVGANGAGKSTLAVDALYFVLYGFTTKELLSDIPTRNRSKSCSIDAVIEENEHKIRIIRAFPLKLSIYLDNKLLNLSTAEANKWIVDKFGDRLFFSKFRLIDAYSKESNFLEEGQVALKRIIFAGMDDYFVNLRAKLTNIKYERELLNKDKVVIYKHYPSEKRLNILITNLTEISNSLVDMNGEIYQNEKDIRTLTGDIASAERSIENANSKLEELKKDNVTLVTKKICYVCKRPLEEHSAKELQEEKEKQIKLIEANKIAVAKDLEVSKTELKITQEVLEQEKTIIAPLVAHKEKIQTLKMKLEARLKQKEYIYTENDVLIAKKAIEELDKMSSYYLVETVSTLEPIINSVLTKINFSVKFDVDTKGKFNIVLTKDDIQYKYKDLSCGQKLILQIAFKIALLLQQNKTGLLVADEGMSSLDNENLQHILTMFEDLPFQLIIVLHRYNEFPDNANVIRLGE